MKNLLLTVILIISLLGQTRAQVYTNKVVGKKNESVKDSLVKEDYPYSLPIWGAATTAKGYQLPYSAGVNVNYFWQESELVLSNLMVGFNNSPMYNLDEIIRFEDAVSAANTINVRPDIWLFPFLNVYGLFVKAKTSTSIEAGLWLPDVEGNWSELSSFSTKANFDATGLGIGMTPTIGVGGGFLALDMNVLWTDVSALDKPVFTFVFGPRLGKTFQFKKPESNIAIWIGGMRVNFSSDTKGNIDLSEIFATNDLQARVDQGLTRVGETSGQVETWWSNLTPIEQKNPVNKAKYETVNRALDAAGNVLTTLDGALNDDKSATIQYALEKNLKNKWNLLLGSQYQINRHLMLRAEYGFLGSRQQFVAGMQYRFGL